MKHAAIPFLLLLLTGCASPPAQPSAEAAGTSPDFTDSFLYEAAVVPFTDLNLIRVDIPPVLRAAKNGPYTPPRDTSCGSLASDIRQLDAVLGPDLEAAARAGQGPLITAHVVENAATSAVRQTTEGVIPFRGWVRKLSGAEQYSREVAAAIRAGTQRRAFLKGYAGGVGCSL